MQAGGHRFDPGTLHLRRYCANRRRWDTVGRDDPAAVVDADLLDEQAEEFLRLLGALIREDLLKLVGEVGESGGLGRRVRLCGKPAAEVGFLLAQRSRWRRTRSWQSAAESSPSSKASKVALELALDTTYLDPG